VCEIGFVHSGGLVFQEMFKSSEFPFVVESMVLIRDYDQEESSWLDRALPFFQRLYDVGMMFQAVAGQQEIVAVIGGKRKRGSLTDVLPTGIPLPFQVGAAADVSFPYCIIGEIATVQGGHEVVNGQYSFGSEYLAWAADLQPPFS